MLVFDKRNEMNGKMLALERSKKKRYFRSSTSGWDFYESRSHDLQLNSHRAHQKVAQAHSTAAMTTPTTPASAAKRVTWSEAPALAGGSDSIG